jgi:hypothetical protein
MTYDYRRAAKKHPDIVALNRKLIGLKPKFQDFASHMFSSPWSIRAWEDGTDVDLTLQPEADRGRGNPSWHIKVQISVQRPYGTPSGLYTVRTTLYDKTNRGRAFHYAESITLADVHPAGLLGPIRQESIKAMEGSTEKEMAELIELTETSREHLVAARYAIDQIDNALKRAKNPLDVEATITQAGDDLDRAGGELERAGRRLAEIVKQVRQSS